MKKTALVFLRAGVLALCCAAIAACGGGGKQIINQSDSADGRRYLPWPDSGAAGATWSAVYLPTPAFETLFAANNRAGGGFGRVVNTRIDDKDAMLLIITNHRIGAFLDNPAAALPESLSNFTFAERPTLVDSEFNRTRDRDTSNAELALAAAVGQKQGRLGVVREVYDLDPARAVYIDDYAPVVLALFPSFSVDDDPHRLMFATLGEPLSSLPPSGAFDYSGYAAVGRVDNNQHTREGAFRMTVDFGTAMVTTFAITDTVNFRTFGGGVSASNLAIDMDTGAFDGALQMTAGTLDEGSIINAAAATADGAVYGQFHGTDAAAVSGVFHSHNNLVLGGFAGSKE